MKDNSNNDNEMLAHHAKAIKIAGVRRSSVSGSPPKHSLSHSPPTFSFKAQPAQPAKAHGRTDGADVGGEKKEGDGYPRP